MKCFSQPWGGAVFFEIYSVSEPFFTWVELLLSQFCFLVERVRENQVLFLAGKTTGCFYMSLYVDDYGETDQGLRWRNPLYLRCERYRKIQKLWHHHSITEEIGHAQEANQTLEDIGWEILDFLG
ncbi:hypothetical protein AMELA_G00084440 [Ameiurus melas]|uniref:E3 ubiquitin-protein ligase n=1 Tax=Ameiurus melas TaxID=219545 RepID=A0A7J6B0U5_AMEME|nr:hypothetical protein AMELA_G00084440 [Ameiurus melas]